MVNQSPELSGELRGFEQCLYGHFSISEETNFHVDVEYLGLHLLYHKMDPDATYDSAHWRAPRSINTNISITDIIQWLSAPLECTGGRLLWITGSTSHVQTAVAYTVSAICKKKGVLGATFFFPQTTSEKSRRKSVLRGGFIPTIIYQLIAYFGQDYAGYICELVARDPSMLDKAPDSQLENLLVEPLKRFPPRDGFVVVISGLDVCEGQEMRHQVDSLLCADLPDNVRFIIISRPKAWIRDVFAKYTPTTISIASSTKTAIGSTLRERIQRLMGALPCMRVWVGHAV